jgi:hypothetical protein
MNAKSKIKIVSLVIIVTLFTVSCSGVVNGDLPPLNIAVSGPMTKGSIVVGGITFDDSQVSVSADESVQSPVYLEDGMMIKLVGTVNPDGVTGSATSVEVENELRGSVSAINGASKTFDVLGFTVIVNGETVFDEGDSFAGLAISDIVEVHGFYVGGGSIRATRVDVLSAAAELEVRGFLTEVTGTTFRIGGSTAVFSYDSATTIIGADSLAVGDLVEAEINSSLYATEIELEEVEDAEYYQKDDVEVEGVVADFVDADTPFLVGSTRVQLANLAQIEGGDIENLRDGVLVEVEGGFVGTTLFVTEVGFQDNVAIVATSDAADAAGMLGITVSASGLTELSGLASVDAISAGDPLAIEGYMLADGSVEAISIELMTEAPEASELVLQGPVTAFVDSETIEILGVTVDVSGASFSNDGGPAITRDEFIALLQIGTVVEAEGSFADGTFSALEAEID